MIRTLRGVLQMPVIARENAEQVGTVSGATIDTANHRFAAIHVGGSKRHARFVDWAAIDSFGEDAVIVTDPGVVRDAANEEEERAARHDAALLDQRVLNTIGDELGTVSDLAFDSDSGTIETIEVGELRLPGTGLLGVGSYAVVVAPPADRT